MSTRRHFVQSLGGALGASRLNAAERPNFIVLLTDDQRFDTIRALGNAEVSTPNMDRLVREGVAFTHAAIMGGLQGAVCVPSRAMLLTGQSLFRASRNTDSTSRDNSPPGPFHLFPELLRENGYTTFATGKWHNGPRLFSRCFTTGANLFFGGMGNQYEIPVQDFDPKGAYGKERTRPTGRHSSEVFAGSAVDFLRSQKADKPFLLYCAFTSPHDPRTAPKQFADLYSPDKVKLPENFLPEHPFDNGELKVRDELLAPFPRTPEVIRRHIADYYAMISEVDAQIGQVLQALERSPWASNTYVIFTGDNGLAVGQHGLMGKQNVYDHSVRVPLIIRGPDLPANKRSDAFVYLYDLFPTICELAGLKTPDTVEGHSLVPLMKGSHRGMRESMFFAYRDFQRAVRTRDWKLIRYRVNGKQTTQLFHLGRDRWEKNDLSGQASMAGRIRELEAELARWQSRVGDSWAV